MNTKTYFLADESATLDLAARLANHAVPPCVIFLYGNLGAGKTTFSRGFLRGLEYLGKVKSPTYALVEPYELEKLTLYHFDFYRLQDIQELEYLGVQDYFTPHSICLIEWPEKAATLLPPPDLSCYIEPSQSGREIKMLAHSTRGKDLLKWIQDEK